MNKESLDQAIQYQKNILVDILEQPLNQLTLELLQLLDKRELLENKLKSMCVSLTHSKHMYILDNQRVQITANISALDKDERQFGRDRSYRPYMQYDFTHSDFHLSEAYISKNRKRPTITAIHLIRDNDKHIKGYLGVDFDIRELPGTAKLYQDIKQWQQIKGDPAIRGGLFSQQRSQSTMDNNIENVFALMEALILEYGIFHGKFHFSSSRTTIWLVDDPYNYRILTMEELNDPDICLIFPKRAYFEKAIVPKNKIREIFTSFQRLRFADENIYLRAASINIVNGMVSLNFSCDGSHYLPYDEFLSKGLSFWFGNNNDLSSLVESICQKGCSSVYEIIDQLQQGENVIELADLSTDERQKVLHELVNIMNVYKT